MIEPKKLVLERNFGKEKGAWSYATGAAALSQMFLKQNRIKGLSAGTATTGAASTSVRNLASVAYLRNLLSLLLLARPARASFWHESPAKSPA